MAQVGWSGIWSYWRLWDLFRFYFSALPILDTSWSFFSIINYLIIGELILFGTLDFWTEKIARFVLVSPSLVEPAILLINAGMCPNWNRNRQFNQADVVLYILPILTFWIHRIFVAPYPKSEILIKYVESWIVNILL